MNMADGYTTQLIIRMTDVHSYDLTHILAVNMDANKFKRASRSTEQTSALYIHYAKFNRDKLSSCIIDDF
jgi:hypothetical protein